MRESQMKKAIAIAVAGAFVAPAYAADITIGGNIEYVYVENGNTNVEDFVTDDNLISISAATELANGLTVTGGFAIEASADNATTTADSSTTVNNPVNDGGHNITIAGDFGSLAIGDVTGAMDTWEYTDVAPYFGGFGADGDDNSVVLTPATGVEGLTLVVGMTFEGDANGNPEGNSYGVGYSVQGVNLYYGKDDTKAATSAQNAWGANTTVAGFYIGYETAEQKSGSSSSGNLEWTGVAAKYTMDNITLAYENQVKSDDGTDESDLTVVSASMDLGGGVNVYIAKADDDTASTVVDKTAVGINYAF
jgi:hypothetical protein